MHVGVLEDDKDQQPLICLWLTSAKHTCSVFGTVARMIDGVKRQHFDTLLLGWMLPDGSGARVLQWVRQNMGWNMVVLVLTARDDEATVVQALQAGADDFVVKPPKQHELIARLAAAARRASPGALPVLRLGAFEIDIPHHTLSMDGAPVTLTQKQFDLAVYLFQSPAKLISRGHLTNASVKFTTFTPMRFVRHKASKVIVHPGADGGPGTRAGQVSAVDFTMLNLETAVDRFLPLDTPYELQLLCAPARSPQ